MPSPGPGLHRARDGGEPSCFLLRLVERPLPQVGQPAGPGPTCRARMAGSSLGRGSRRSASQRPKRTRASSGSARKSPCPASASIPRRERSPSLRAAASASARGPPSAAQAEEPEVVRVYMGYRGAGRLCAAKYAVDPNRRAGCRRGVRVAAHAPEGVRGHVHQVARARHQRREALGGGTARSGCRRGLHGVDVVVVGARVVRVARQHATPAWRRSPRVYGVGPAVGVHSCHGLRSISASANSVAASRSSGKRRATSRMASA